MKRSRMRIWVALAGLAFLAQAILWWASSSDEMAAEAWAQTVLHLAEEMEPLEPAMDVLLRDELRPSVDGERIAEVTAALARINGRLFWESEGPAHERGDGSSLYHCAEANWSTPVAGSVYVTYFGYDWNGDEVWMAFTFGRWLRIGSRIAWM